MSFHKFFQSDEEVKAKRKNAGGLNSDRNVKVGKTRGTSDGHLHARGTFGGRLLGIHNRGINLIMQEQTSFERFHFRCIRQCDRRPKK